MLERLRFLRLMPVGMLLVASFLLVALLSTQTVSGRDPDDHTRRIAQGAGTTIIHGGTGPTGGFLPVLTTIAFHAEKSAGGVTGAFECLALAPEAGTGSKSAQFTVNAMYVTGQITGATVNGDGATLTGTSVVTGLGAGLNLPFTFEVQRGGPGTTSVLKVNGLTFNEILVEGSFQVQSED